MVEYSVKLLSRALRDLDGIYAYISRTLLEKNSALALADRIAEGIYSLGQMPYRCPQRKHGIYANRGYRQLFVENFTVIYRVDEEKKEVIVVTIRYSPSEF